MSRKCQENLAAPTDLVVLAVHIIPATVAQRLQCSIAKLEVAGSIQAAAVALQ